MLIGYVRQGDWFQWVKSIVQITYRIVQIVLLILTGLIIVLMLSNDEVTRFEPIRTLINLSLLLGLYYANMMQSFVLSLVVGLYTTSLDLSQRVSSFIGLLTYVMLQLIPYLTALALLIVLHSALPNPHPAVTIGLDIVVLGSIYIARELSIHLLWNQLTKRLNTSSSYAVTQ